MTKRSSMATGLERRSRAKVGLSAATAFAVLAGCTQGPDFVRPTPPTASSYARSPVPAQTVSADTYAGAAQRFAEGGDLPGEWWTLFHSEALNRIIAKAIKANPDLQSAQAALHVARENVLAQRGVFYPSVDAGFSPSHQKVASSLASPLNSNADTFDLFSGQISVSYTPDVFGLNHRTAESLQAQADVQRFQVEATYLTLTSNLVAAAIQEAALRDQIAANEQIATLERQAVDLVRRQRAIGQAAQSDITAQEAALAQTEAALPPLKKQLAQQRDLLTALMGSLPSEEPDETFALAALHLPEELPVSLPSQLVEQRPDIRAAEASLHAASAQIGVAMANRLPNITLTGALGGAGTTIANMFSGGNIGWDIAGDIAAPIFHGNALQHQERAARAAYDQASAQYRSVVVSSFQNVADTLHALAFDADSLKGAAHAEQVAATNLEIVRGRAQIGAANTLALLNAEQSYQQALINLAQARASRYADTVALFQALGGGWWNRPDDTAPQKDAAAIP